MDPSLWPFSVLPSRPGLRPWSSRPILNVDNGVLPDDSALLLRRAPGVAEPTSGLIHSLWEPVPQRVFWPLKGPVCPVSENRGVAAQGGSGIGPQTPGTVPLAPLGSGSFPHSRHSSPGAGPGRSSHAGRHAGSGRGLT